MMGLMKVKDGAYLQPTNEVTRTLIRENKVEGGATFGTVPLETSSHLSHLSAIVSATVTGGAPGNCLTIAAVAITTALLRPLL